MRPDPVSLTFGDKEFTIRPLTLGQIRKIDAILRRSAKEGPEYLQIDVSTDIISVALSRDYPDHQIDELEIGMMEIGSIVQQILTVGGMVVVEKKPGESDPVLQTGT